MDNQARLRKLYFNIKLSGWLGAFPAVATWNMYKVSGFFVYALLAIITVIISLYILITSDQSSWQNKAKVTKFTILSILFAGVLPAIPLFLSIKYTDGSK